MINKFKDIGFGVIHNDFNHFSNNPYGLKAMVL